jgi:hypothetical protein
MINANQNTQTKNYYGFQNKRLQQNIPREGSGLSKTGSISLCPAQKWKWL